MNPTGPIFFNKPPTIKDECISDECYVRRVAASALSVVPLPTQSPLDDQEVRILPQASGSLPVKEILKAMSRDEKKQPTQQEQNELNAMDGLLTRHQGHLAESMVLLDDILAKMEKEPSPDDSWWQETIHSLFKVDDKLRCTNWEMQRHFFEKTDDMFDFLQVADQLGIHPWEVKESQVQAFVRREQSQANALRLQEQKRKQNPKHRVKTEVKLSSVETTPPPVAIHCEALPSPEEARHALLQQWLREPSLPLAYRVARWEKGYKAIREFTDPHPEDENKRTQKYLDPEVTPDEKLSMIKDIHSTWKAEQFIRNPIFSMPTPTGAALRCSLQRNGMPAVYGSLYFGIRINKKTHREEIYHMCFKEDRDGEHSLSDIFRGPKISSDAQISAEDQPWIFVGTGVTVSEEGAVKIQYPNGNMLTIDPVRKDLLPTPPFKVQQKATKK